MRIDRIDQAYLPLVCPECGCTEHTLFADDSGSRLECLACGNRWTLSEWITVEVCQ